MAVATAEAVKEATIRRYRLLTSIHYEANPDLDPTDLANRHRVDRHLRYEKGDVIESARSLADIYPNKFEMLPEREGPVAVTEERKQAVSDLISKGWAEVDRDFLEQLSNDGFARVSRNADARTGESIQSEPKAASPFGEDVTSKFQQAYDHGFKVYRNPAGKHQVIRPGGKKPVNPSPLEEAAVEPFVADYLKETKYG